MKEQHLYDLDGTLSRLNNTFDFIYRYLRAERHWLRFWAGKATEALLFLFPMGYPRKRRIIITVLFCGLKTKDLERYFETRYKPLFLTRLTKLGKQLLERPKKGTVLLTGCTEIPAKAIAKLFRMDKVICTTFTIEQGRIKGIDQDTYGDLKKRHILKMPKERLIYYTDDPSSEGDLISIMDRTIIVREGSR